MPTYRNDSDHTTYRVENVSGEIVKLKPGHSSGTKYLYDVDDLTKTSDTPYYNPVVAVDHVITSNTEVDIASLAKGIEIVNASGQLVSMCFDSVLNTPSVPIVAGSFRNVNNPKDYASKLVFTFSEGNLTSGELVINQWDRTL